MRVTNHEKQNRTWLEEENAVCSSWTLCQEQKKSLDEKSSPGLAYHNKHLTRTNGPTSWSDITHANCSVVEEVGSLVPTENSVSVCWTDILSQKAGSTFLTFWFFFVRNLPAKFFHAIPKVILLFHRSKNWCFSGVRFFFYMFWTVPWTIHLQLTLLKAEHWTEWPIQLSTEQRRKKWLFSLSCNERWSFICF